MRPYWILLAITVSLLSTLAGCGSSPTSLYVLSANAEKTEAPASRGVSIGIGPVTLPKYLDRPQIVTRAGSNSLTQGDFDQWGGDLNDNITRVLSINLANLLGTDRVSFYPWRDPAAVDYQVALDITRFDGGENGVGLDVFWSLINPSSGKTLVMRRSTYPENGALGTSGSPDDKSRDRAYAAAAAAMSRDLEALSRDIAAAIRQQRAF